MANGLKKEALCDASLLSAAHAGDERKLRSALKDGASVSALSKTGWTALMIAALNGRDGCVRILLEAGADPNWSGGDPRHEPLLQAAKGGHLQCARSLLEAGADPNARDVHDSPALLTAVIAERPMAERITMMLIDAGADWRAPRRRGGTLLMDAALRGYEELAIRLLELGADPGERDEKGATALHWAARMNKTGVARILLGAGADPRQADDSGALPEDWGRKSARGRECAEFLRGASLAQWERERIEGSSILGSGKAKRSSGKGKL